MSDTRWCQSGYHPVLRSRFRKLPRGGLSTVCMSCEARKTPPSNRKDGVDIDEVHFKLGRVKPGVRRRP